MFIRASHLPNGDYLLVGMEEWPTPAPGDNMPLYSRARHEECQMYYLNKAKGSIPVPFGPKFYEGAAIGKKAGRLPMWKDGAGSDCVRLTHINDFKNYQAHNATVAPDGKSMVYQISHGSGHSDMVSRGFVLYRFE